MFHTSYPLNQNRRNYSNAFDAKDYTLENQIPSYFNYAVKKSAGPISQPKLTFPTLESFGF